jgi:catechol 2,3-dioxygenase-like lactoylglutathione lyase family enzyme
MFTGTGRRTRMIVGAHAIIYTKDAEADRAFLRDVIGLSSVDVGGGWLIFALPPSEVALHPSERNDVHELYLMCDDVDAFIAEMSVKKVRWSKIQEEQWGRMPEVALPGGGNVGVYQPLHARPRSA